MFQANSLEEDVYQFVAVLETAVEYQTLLPHRVDTRMPGVYCGCESEAGLGGFSQR